MALVNHTRIRRGGMAAIAAVVVFIALTVASSVPPWAVEQPTASPAGAPTASGAGASADGEMTASRKGKSNVGIRGYGFVLDNDVFTTIDAPGAGAFTVAFGIDDRGRTVGGYVDDRGRLHGFLRGQEAFTVIDVPGAAATFVSRINAQGQIVGAYSDDPHVPAIELPHGFLLDDGVFTTIDAPGAINTNASDINDRGRIVGFYLGTNEGQ
jgi:uncharacterized membrane protein